MKYQSVAVFCGSKAGSEPLFTEHAAQLGKLLAAAGIRMVYGGGKVGLMGTIANNVMQYGGEVIGVIPEILDNREQSNREITELHIVPDMHTRKRMMYNLCDAAIIMAGGVGTMDELFEMYTWNNLSIHNKKIILLNTAGFYNALIQHFDTMHANGFMYDSWRERVGVCSTPDEVLAILNSSNKY
ncbi:MAG: TIGR00730 family Rossman fold protein [Chitinophagaceae bacterium]